MNQAVTSFKTHQNAPQAQIGDEAMADAIRLVKTLETPYLRDLRRLIDTEIMARAKSDRTEAIFKIQQIALGLGVSVQELISSAAPRKGNNAGKKYGPAEVKFIHPENPELTWTGRGATPKWLKAWDDQHGSRDALLIQKA